MPRWIYDHSNNHTTRKHWLSDTKFNVTYRNLRDRCTKITDREYKNYWLRWIKCERETFEDFLNDMYESFKQHNEIYWWRNTQIDRIDYNWNYCKSNCRRVTIKEQANNKRNIKIINYNWIDYHAKELSLKFNIPYKTFLWRLSKWKDINELIKPINILYHHKNKDAM